jgi:hypothetical protein
MEQPQCFEIIVQRSDGKIMAHSRIACPTAEDLKAAVESAAQQAASNYTYGL